jgi:hypothetical protein
MTPKQMGNFPAEDSGCADVPVGKVILQIHAN